MKEATEAQLAGFPNWAMSLVLWHVCMGAYTIPVRRKGHPGLGLVCFHMPPSYRSKHFRAYISQLNLRPRA